MTVPRKPRRKLRPVELVKNPISKGVNEVGIDAALGSESACRVGRARRAFLLSALSRAALVGYSVRCLRSWDLRRMICWARLRLKSRTSSKRGELQGSSLCAQREAGLVARCSSVRADPRLRPGRTETEAEALRPACPIPPGQREEGHRECVDLPSAADASEAWNRSA